MRSRNEAQERRRTKEFSAFTAGAAGRLLHVAMLLTCDDEGSAERLLCGALSRTYADWFRMRGEDPYAYTRQELVTRFSRRSTTRWLHRWPKDGRLSRLNTQERLVIVLRLYEGVDDEQIGAVLGLPPDRIRAICARASGIMRSEPVEVPRQRLSEAAPTAGPAGIPAGGRP